MSVPAPNLYPDFNIIRLSHVCLNVKDLVASRKFYSEILGLQITDESDSHISVSYTHLTLPTSV